MTIATDTSTGESFGGVNAVSPGVGRGAEGLSTRKKALFAGCTVVLVLVCLELLSYLAIAVLETRPGFTLERIDARLADHARQLETFLANHGNGRLILDEQLGWAHAPGVRHVEYSSNSIGVRGVREYTAAPPAGVVRVAAFGDSLVYGTEVNDGQTWSAQLEAMAPDIEALNYAVGGYGPDQALMMFEQRGLERSPHVVVLGIADVNYERIVSRYRGFIPGGRPLYKPRYVLDDAGGLSVVPVPLAGPERMRRIVEDPRVVLAYTGHDWNYDPMVWDNPLYDRVAMVRLGASVFSRAWQSRMRPDRFYVGGQMNTHSEPFGLMVAIVRRFDRLAGAGGCRFTLMIFPTRDSDIWGPGPRVYQPLVDALAETDILDLADALRDDPGVTPVNMRMPNRHYAPQTNGAVARALRRHLAGVEAESGVR